MARFTFPAWLEGTPAERAAESERQAQAINTRAHMTEAERLIGRGRLLEETARENLKQSFGVKGKEEERQLAKSQLADALGMQGRYEEASEIHPERHRRKHFRDVIKAIEMPDDEKCHCSDHKVKMNDTEVEITPRFERARVYSPAHGELVSLVECSHCGHLNARPLRSRLLRHNEAIERNEAIAHSELEVKRFLSDPQILNAGT